VDAAGNFIPEKQNRNRRIVIRLYYDWGITWVAECKNGNRLAGLIGNACALPQKLPLRPPVNPLATPPNQAIGIQSLQGYPIK
jgi:hypothetical protein